MEENPNILGVRGLAIELGVSVKWIFIEADAGRLPFVQIGARRLFDLANVRRAIASRISAEPCVTSGTG